MSYDKTQLPKLEPLEPRLLLSGLSDLMDVATDLSVTTPADMDFAGTIDAPRQSHMYQFTAQATSRLIVDMVAEGGLIDPFLTLYNASGRRRRKNNNAYRGTLDSRIAYIIEPGQTYYIRASGRRKTTGQYRIRVRTTLDDQHGDTLETAGLVELSPSGRKRIRASIDHADDVDVMLFTATRSGAMTVLQFAGRKRETMNCLMHAYDGEGSLLTSNEATVAASSPNTVSFNVVEGQQYYLAVSGHEQATGRYRLALRTKRDFLPPAPEPEPDPDPQPDPEPDPPIDIVPGSQVVAHTLQTLNGLQLVVLGTDLTDSITLTQTSQGITLASGAGTEGFTGTYTSVLIYGFGGGDILRIANSVTLAGTLYGGDGNDWIFDAGMGAGSLYGGAGDDLLVSIGGSADSLRGEDGLDSFWLDSSDVIGDVSSAENAAAAVHQVGNFYQPYTTDTSSPDYVSLQIAGQDLTDPAITSYATGYANFADRPVFVNGPAYNDIAQGYLGDCYMLATLASLADTDGQVIEQMIAPLGDGTFAVRFYDGSTPVYLRVDGDLPVRFGGSLAYADFSPDGDMWVALTEKAYAYFRYGQNSYASLHGGWMSDVNGHVTGRSSIFRSTTSLGEELYSFMDTQLAGGHAVTLGSRYTASGPVVASHAYVVMEVHEDAGQQYVTVYNPWGVDGRSWDGNYSDGLLTLTADQIILHFSAAVVC